MGIHLDWEVESDAGWDDIGEDPELIARRRNLQRNLRILLIVLALLVLGGATAVTLRLRQVRGQLIATLEQAVASETLALRLGDESAFMRGQANIARWRRNQENAFEDYQSAVPDLVPGGEIISLDLNGSDARVVLLEELDGQPHEVVWFYHHDDTGWYHVPDIPAYWGDTRHIVTAYADVAYTPPDELYAETLAARIDTIVAEMCRHDVCGASLLQFPVEIDPDALTYVHWTSDDPPILIVDSPQNERLPAGQSAELISDRDLQRLLVMGWSRTLLADMGNDVELRWLEQHLVIWLNHQIDPALPASGLFVPLEEAYGTDFVPRFLSQLYAGQDALLAFSAAIADPPLAPTGEDDLSAQIAAYLRVEFALRATGYADLADALFVEVPYGGYRAGRRSTAMRNVAASSISVLRTRQEGDLLWAEIIFQPADEADYQLRGSLLGAVPFREVDGRWLRVEPTLSDWGPRQSIEQGGASITYHQLDEEYALAVLSYLQESAYPQVIADFGLTSAPPLDIIMTPDSHEFEASFRLERTTDGVNIVMPSPYLYLLRVDESVENAVRRMSATNLLHEVFANLTGERVYDSIRIALIDREMENLGLTYWDYYGRVISPATFREADDLTLDDLWGNTETVISREYALEHASAAVLVDLVVERYGDAILDDLVANFATSGSTTEWLERSGVDPASLENEWHARVELMLEALEE